MDNIINALSNSGKEFWAIFYLLLISSVAGYVFKYVSKQNCIINKLNTEVEDLKSITLSLSRYCLKDLYDNCKNKGIAREDDKDEFFEIYDKYSKDLKGNGSAKTTKNKFMELFNKTGDLDYGQLMEISQKGKTEIIREVIKIMDVRCNEIKEYIDKNIMT